MSRKISELPSLVTLPVDHEDIQLPLTNLNDLTSYRTGRAKLRTLLDYPPEAIVMTSHGLAIAAEGAMAPRALAYDGVTFSLATSADVPISVWGEIVAVVDANNVLARIRSDCLGRVYQVAGLQAALSAADGEIIYLQSDGTNGTLTTGFRQFQFRYGVTDEFLMDPGLLGLTGASAATSRKDGSDDLGSVSGAVEVNFSLGNYDNKELVLSGDTTFTLTAVRGGEYGMVIDNSGGHTITWATSFNGATPIIGSSVGIATFVYAKVAGTFHTISIG